MGAFENRCTTSTAGSSYQNRSSDTRQLCAPKSIAISAFRFFIGSIKASKDSVRQRLTQKCFGQPAIDGNQVSRGATRLRAGQEEDRGGTVGRLDGLMR